MMAPPHFHAELNPDMFHFTPSLYWMRGEYENGADAGCAVIFSFLWFTTPLQWD